MKKKQIVALKIVAMKITIVQLVILFFAFTASADNANGQDVLNKSVTLSVEKMKIKAVLQQVQKVANVKFVFSSRIISANRIVSFSVISKKLGELLNEIILPLNIGYKVIDDQIVLFNKPNKTAESKISSIETIASVNYVYRDVSGIVTDQNGKPLSGVSVSIKGSGNGTTTDENGKFSLSFTSDVNIELVFSFVGYQPKVVAVGQQTQFTIALTEFASSLGEVIVVGYGTQKKASVTGAVVQINGAEIKKSPAVNMSNSLAGRLPGAIINNRNGEPGRDDPSILIRGMGTTGDNSPLIIIDGVPRDGLGRLDPNDVETISVLKDASAAIYGARGGNGVILVTTKRGKAGKPEFNFTLNQAFNKPTRILKVMDAVTFAQVRNEADWYRAGRPTNFSPLYSPADIQKYADGSDPLLHPNTDWVKQVLKPSSLQNKTNFSVRGGSENVKYYFSFGALYQDGNYKYNPTAFNQFNIRSNIDVNVTSNLRVSLDIAGRLEKGRYSSSGVSTNFFNILHASPLTVAKYPNGLIGPGRLGENPLTQDQVGYSKIDNMPIYTTLSAEYKVPGLKGLSFGGSYNFDVRNQFNKTFRTPYYYHQYNATTTQYDRVRANVIPTPELTDRYERYMTFLYNITARYERRIKDHNFAAVIGWEQQKNFFNFAQAFRRNFLSTAVDQINVGSTAAADKDNAGSASAGAYNNYFGRLNYGYKGRYLIEGVFRYDGSQVFPKNNRYGFFPGGSIGWIISEESFFTNVNFVDHLKLRASHGQLGNDKIPAYQYLATFSFGDNYVFGGIDAPGVVPGVLPNPRALWEVAKKTDIGLEATMWKGMLGIELDVFKERRSNILRPRNLSVPSTFGFPGLPNENLGVVDNKGLEITVSHKNHIAKFNYNIAAYMAYARNKVVFIDEVPQATPLQNATGHPIGTGLYYRPLGIFKTNEDLAKYPHYANAQPGDLIIEDVNGDGVINSLDQVRIDYNNIPQMTFGLNMQADFKGFDLSALLQGQARVRYDVTGEFNSKFGNTANDNTAMARSQNRWTVDNINGTMPRAAEISPTNNLFWLYDASFVRLKSLELGYSFSNSLISRLKLKGARLYVSGFNLITLSKFDFLDPEMNTSYLYYPQMKTFNIGVNLTF